MPHIDFSKVADIHDFLPLPEGAYRSRIVRVKKATTRDGVEMWLVRFEIVEGEFKGRYIFDNLVFNDTGLKRVKLLCGVLDLDMSGEIDLAPDMITDGICRVDIGVEDYEDEKGSIKARNKVRFAGFLEDDGPTVEDGDTGDDDIPF